MAAAVSGTGTLTRSLSPVAGAAPAVDQRRELVKALDQASWWKGRLVTLLESLTSVGDVRAQGDWSGVGADDDVNEKLETAVYARLEGIVTGQYPSFQVVVSDLKAIYERVVASNAEFAAPFENGVSAKEKASADWAPAVALLKEQIKFAKTLDRLDCGIEQLEGSKEPDDAKGDLQVATILFNDAVEDVRTLDSTTQASLISDVLGHLEAARTRMNTAIEDLKETSFLDKSIEPLDEITLTDITAAAELAPAAEEEDDESVLNEGAEAGVEASLRAGDASTGNISASIAVASAAAGVAAAVLAGPEGDTVIMHGLTPGAHSVLLGAQKELLAEYRAHVPLRRISGAGDATTAATTGAPASSDASVPSVSSDAEAASSAPATEGAAPVSATGTEELAPAQEASAAQAAAAAAAREAAKVRMGQSVESLKPWGNLRFNLVGTAGLPAVADYLRGVAELLELGDTSAIQAAIELLGEQKAPGTNDQVKKALPANATAESVRALADKFQPRAA